MLPETLVQQFMLNACSGISKQQLSRFYKEEYELDDIDIDYIIKKAGFNKAPRFINYLDSVSYTHLTLPTKRIV